MTKHTGKQSYSCSVASPAHNGNGASRGDLNDDGTNGHQRGLPPYPGLLNRHNGVAHHPDAHAARASNHTATLVAEDAKYPFAWLDAAAPAADMRGEVVDGLSQPQKTLPCKLFYDARGSELFDGICDLPEYYPTRTELHITRTHAAHIAAALGPGCLLVEYGSGASRKTCVLLDHLRDCAGYIPIDISPTQLRSSCQYLSMRYPRLPITAICADYTAPITLPPTAAANIIAYFPGSTIGNFEPAAAREFLASIRQTCGPASALLIGVDLKKDPAILHAAYNDSSALTGAFNLNILTRLNGELDANFDESAFCHYAYFNLPAGRVEMHLVSRRRQTVRVGDCRFSFGEGESIHTENCYKFTLDDFESLAAEAGYTLREIWMDDAKWFSVQLYSAQGAIAHAP